jgi:hypothetical protein
MTYNNELALFSTQNYPCQGLAVEFDEDGGDARIRYVFNSLGAWQRADYQARK